MADAEQLEEWIYRTASGDRPAFKSLYEATSARLFGLCRQHLAEAGAAEAALLQVYQHIWQQAGLFPGDARPAQEWLEALTLDQVMSQPGARLGSGTGELRDTMPPKNSFSAIESELFSENKQSFLARIGLIPAILGAVAAALILLGANYLGLLETGPGRPAPASAQEDVSKTSP